MRFDGGLGSAAVFFAPNNLQFGAFGDFVIHGAQRQCLLFVEGIAGEQRQTNGVAVSVDNCVVVAVAVVRERKVEELVLFTFRFEQGRDDLLDVFLVPFQGDLLPLHGRIDLLQRVGADEVVVELDERAIAQFPRVQVIVFDLFADEGTADGAGCFIAVGTEPFAVILQLVAGVDRRQRGGSSPIPACSTGKRANQRRSGRILHQP